MTKIIKKAIRFILNLLGIQELEYINQQAFEITCRSVVPTCPFIRCQNDGKNTSGIVAYDEDETIVITWSPYGISYLEITDENTHTGSIDSYEELVAAMNNIRNKTMYDISDIEPIVMMETKANNM